MSLSSVKGTTSTTTTTTATTTTTTTTTATTTTTTTTTVGQFGLAVMRYRKPVSGRRGCDPLASAFPFPSKDVGLYKDTH